MAGWDDVMRYCATGGLLGRIGVDRTAADQHRGVALTGSGGPLRVSELLEKEYGYVREHY